MKIAALHLGFFYSGGGERLVLEEVKGLRQMGHEVECFAPIVDEQNCYPELLREVGVHRLLPSPPSWLPAKEAIWVLLSCLLSPLLVLRLRRYEVILACNQPSLFIAMVARLLFGTPYAGYLAQPNRVIYPRQVDLESNHTDMNYRFFYGLALIGRPLIRWLDKLSLKRAGTLLANGSYMAFELQRIYGLPFICCPAGAHPESGEVPSERDSGQIEIAGHSIQMPYVLLTNRHYPQKRFDLALQALVEGPRCRLVITGAPTSYTQSIKALAHQLGIADRVVFTGLVDNLQLQALYSHAKAYIYPAPEEDFGMGIIEAMAHGVPVVAWRKAGPTSTVIDGQTGYLINLGDTLEMGQRLKDLITRVDLARNMGLAGWRLAQSELSYTSHLKKLIQSLLAIQIPAPLRVGLFHCGFTYSGGGERMVLETALGLRARGYTVDCYVPTLDSQKCYPELVHSVLPQTFLPQFPKFFPFHNAIQMGLASLLVPLYAWRFRKIDCFIGCNQPGAWIAFWCAKILNKPYVAYLNQPNRLLYPRSVDTSTGWRVNSDYQILDKMTRVLRPFIRWADNRSIKKASILLVNGGYIGSQITSIYQRDVLDCPAGTHTSDDILDVSQRFNGRLSLGNYQIQHPYILLTNRHYPQKRFDVAIKALSELKEFPALQLVVPGPATTHTKELKQLARDLGVQDRVIFCGTIDEKTLQNLYRCAAVYVYTAPEEDFGMGVIEAMSHGIPVVAWNWAGPTVTIAHERTGYLAQKGDLDDYVRGIQMLLEDQDLNAKWGLQGHLRSRQFSWDRHVETIATSALRALGKEVLPIEKAA